MTMKLHTTIPFVVKRIRTPTKVGDVVFTGADAELELLVDTARNPTRCVITETVSLEKEWASVEVPTWVD